MGRTPAGRIGLSSTRRAPFANVAVVRIGRIRVALAAAVAGSAGLLLPVLSPGAPWRSADTASTGCPAGTTAAKTTTTVPVTEPDDAGRPVSISADVYTPVGAAAPAGGFPLLEIFHGGGSTKDNTYDAGHAAFFAAHCYVVLLYSQRGNGASGGQEAVAGPKEMHDLYDMTAWVAGLCPATGPVGECAKTGLPPRPPVPVDPTRIALAGYSQGGLNTNLGEAWSGDPSLDPYGIHFAALLPGNTPDYVFDALVPHGVVKLSVGVGLVETYATGPKENIDPILAKWIATAGADVPSLYGDLSHPCDVSVHDTLSSTMVQDLAWRSVGCFATRLTAPTMWAQSFDDAVFPPDMAIDMFGPGVHGMPAIPASTPKVLYLTMGGHAAPAAPAAAEADKLAAQLQFLDRALGMADQPALPPVVYWTRDPTVGVPAGSYQYPDGAWLRRTAATWPPPGATDVTYVLSADGHASAGAGGPAVPATEPLLPFAEDEAHDSVAAAAASATPLGTSPVPSEVPATDSPGLVAAFRTAPLTADRELDGPARLHVTWTPSGPDSQVVLEVFDAAPDGTLTLLSRGVTGIRGAVPGRAQAVEVDGNSFSALLHAGHRLVAWVMDGDLAFYKPYPDNVGGLLGVGPGATLSIPLRPAG